ncbi:MAG: DNA polymerase I [Abditibacteriales bacterium]|nr:DNA polymerase I [Abditibacteriales bacterium]MDW8365554.1 DNA polymerase I [Abditibacteriales bacterium]
MSKVLLVDAYSLIFRAFYSTPPLTTKDGQPTNAVYGFLRMLLKLLREEQPDYIVVAFDAMGPTFRHQAFDDYKATRQETPSDLLSQFAIVQEVLDAFGIMRAEVRGYEADDIIGTLARRAAAEGKQVLAVTGDHDMLQLVSDRVQVMVTERGISQTTRYDPKAVEERYGFPPPLIPDYKGLRGDASDNIPGVPGIGEKTAKELVQRFGSVENILAHVAEVKPARAKVALEQHANQALFSKRLATIVTDLPLEFEWKECACRTFDAGKVRPVLEKYEFHSLLNQFALRPAPVAVNVQAFQPANLPTAPYAVYVDATNDTVHGIAICAEESSATYIIADDIPELKAALENPEVAKFTHDYKTTLRLLRRCGIELRGVTADTMLMSYLLNPARQNHPLSDVARENTTLELPQREQRPASTFLFDEGDATQKTEDAARNTQYACAAAAAIFRLVPVLRQRLEEVGELKLFEEIELPLPPILADMEEAGMLLDVAYLRQLAEELGKEADRIEGEIFELAGQEFNLNSPKQLGAILFDKLGLPAGRKTKTGYSTDASVLEQLAEKHDIARKILAYREVAKLKSTYADGLLALVNPTTHRVHTTLLQTGTATGRLSSQEPNLQNIPIRTDIGQQFRRAFIAPSGHVLVCADYSQIELRILAHITQDPALVQAFQNDEDVHARTAAHIHQVAPAEVTAEQRRLAKMVNYAVIYGLSAFGLAQQLKIEPAEAQAFIDAYFATFPGVRRYIDETLHKAREVGYVTTLFGRRRYIPDIHVANQTVRQAAERAAINAPIQGSSADIMKLGMIRAYQALKQRPHLKARMVLQVHDELIFEAPASEAPEIATLVHDAMSRAFALRVPLKVDVSVGTNWRDKEPVVLSL